MIHKLHSQLRGKLSCQPEATPNTQRMQKGNMQDQAWTQMQKWNLEDQFREEMQEGKKE